MIQILFIVFLSLTSFAYTSGDEYCRQHAQDEIGRFHSVSSDLKIYSYFKRPFNKNIPTIVFFSGGPGSSIRGNEFSLDGYNVLFFEERGMGCSRPDNEKTFLNPDTYGSLKTVRDVKTILRDYQLEKVILYGHSYGTVPATIFASEYPSLTEKVVLEGTIFKGDIGIWRSEIRKRNLQKTFENLTPEEQEKVLHFSGHHALSPDWFSVVGTMMSYLDNGYEIYVNFLRNVLTMEDEAFVSFLQSFYPPVDFEQDGKVVFGMIACQELSANSPTSNLHLVFDKTHVLQWKEGSDVRKSYCIPLKARARDVIDLSHYPIHVPVLYLAGEQDGVTDLTQVKNHFAQVARGKKVLYVSKGGGHLPNLGMLKDDRECRDKEDCAHMAPVKAQVKFFRALLEESPLTEMGPWFKYEPSEVQSQKQSQESTSDKSFLHAVR